jgi:hypothetical protein
MSEEHSRSEFTSWKLDAIDLLRCDKKTSPTARLIGLAILQHVNVDRMVADVSIDRLAAQVGITRENANRHVTALKSRGWFKVYRPNQTRVATYRFDPSEALCSAVLEAKDFRQNEAKLAMSERRKQLIDVTEATHQIASDQRQLGKPDVTEATPQDCLDVTEASHPDVTFSYVPNVTESSPKHLRVNHLQETPIKKEGYGEEVKASAYARASGGW